MPTVYSEAGVSFAHNRDEHPSCKNNDFNLHVHDFYEMVCFVSGDVKYLVEGHEYNMRPGCVMLIRPAEVHEIIICGDVPYERYVIHFQPRKLTCAAFDESVMSVFHDRGLGENNRYLATDLPGLDIVRFFSQIEEECGIISPQAAVLSGISTVLCLSSVAFRKKRALPSSSKLSEEERELLDYVNRNLLSPLTLEDVAAHLYVSKSHLTRTFKRLTGTTVYDYVLSKRIIEAQKMIAEGESAARASQACGFSDYSSFYRIYKKKFGVSPAATKTRGADREG